MGIAVFKPIYIHCKNKLWKLCKETAYKTFQCDNDIYGHIKVQFEKFLSVAK